MLVVVYAKIGRIVQKVKIVEIFMKA